MRVWNSPALGRGVLLKWLHFSQLSMKSSMDSSLSPCLPLNFLNFCSLGITTNCFSWGWDGVGAPGDSLAWRVFKSSYAWLCSSCTFGASVWVPPPHPQYGTWPLSSFSTPSALLYFQDFGSQIIFATPLLVPKCDRAARVGEVANDNQRKTKCVQNKQEFNGQLVEKKYNKTNTRKTNKATKGKEKRRWKGQ